MGSHGPASVPKEVSPNISAHRAVHTLGMPQGPMSCLQNRGFAFLPSPGPPWGRVYHIGVDLAQVVRNRAVRSQCHNHYPALPDIGATVLFLSSSGSHALDKLHMWPIHSESPAPLSPVAQILTSGTPTLSSRVPKTSKSQEWSVSGCF